MKLKLLRKDCENAEPLVLETGKHVIGRGAPLNCSDKRISRQHGLIEVWMDGKVEFTATHTNPCFYFPLGNSESGVLLKNGEHQIIQSGDEISLLPDAYQYSINIVEDNTVINDNNISSQQTNQSTDKMDKELETNETQIYEGVPDNRLNSSDDDVIPVIEERKVISLDEDEIELDFNGTEPSDDNDAPSPSLLGQVSPSILEEESSSKRPAESVTDEDNAEGSDAKRHRSNSPQEGKSNVTELQASGSSQQSADALKIKIEPDAEAGTSSVKKEPVDSGAASNVKKEKAEDSEDDAGASAKRVSSRPRCDYGSSCYRKNPQHRVDFSHPADQDWGSPSPCPFGADCYRQNPMHRLNFTHPGPPALRVQPPAGNGLRTVRVERNGNVFHITANAVNFYDDHFEVEDYDGDSVDYDYEF